MGAKRVANSNHGKDIRQVFLLDNMSLVLALARCRSKNFLVLTVLRKFYAYALAKHIRCFFRWIPSELNSSDAPSRADGGEHLLTHDLDHMIATRGLGSSSKGRDTAAPAKHGAEASSCVVGGGGKCPPEQSRSSGEDREDFDEADCDYEKENLMQQLGRRKREPKTQEYFGRGWLVRGPPGLGRRAQRRDVEWLKRIRAEGRRKRPHQDRRAEENITPSTSTLLGRRHESEGSRSQLPGDTRGWHTRAKELPEGVGPLEPLPREGRSSSSQRRRDRRSRGRLLRRVFLPGAAAQYGREAPSRDHGQGASHRD